MSLSRPVMTQSWTRLTYLHWPCDPEVVRPFFPDGVEPDVFDGASWVGLIPFAMRDVRVLGVRVPYVADFLETNVRLYGIDGEGRRSVVFLSLDADRLLPVLAARTAYRLPYVFSAMSLEQHDDELTYAARRRVSGVRSRIRVRIGGPVEATPLDTFLTARWLLHSRFYGATAIAQISHPTWPLRSAELLELDDGLVTASGLPAPVGPPRVLHSDGVDVRLGAPERLAASDGVPRGDA
jgi:uncharacterized protein YqjF (DUF2071 family)